jgi:hypothetical protein
MTRWKPRSEAFTVGDVLRWQEPDWFQKGKRKKEFFKKGERTVSAQVLGVGAVYLKLKVLRCEVVFDQSAKGVKVLKPGEEITRKLSTLQARGAIRIDWGGEDGESARAHVTSRFLSGD